MYAYSRPITFVSFSLKSVNRRFLSTRNSLIDVFDGSGKFEMFGHAHLKYLVFHVLHGILEHGLDRFLAGIRHQTAIFRFESLQHL